MFFSYFTFLFSLYCYSPILYTGFFAKIQTIFPKKNNSSLDAVILDSFEIMIKICGYIVLFSIMILLTNHLFQSRKVTLSCCFLEVTTGLKNIMSLSFLEIEKKFALAFALLNFGGICSIFQVKSVTSTDFSLAWYITAKAFISLFTYQLALFLF